VESGQAPLALARDFDGILWIKTVHAPHMLSRRFSWIILLLTMFHYRMTLIAAGVLFFGGLVTWALFRRRKKRRARSAREAERAQKTDPVRRLSATDSSSS
jgi:predicted membrane protein